MSDDWAEVTLDNVAGIAAKLVDPTLPEYRDLPHIGIDKIVSASGRLLPLATAAEDRVTSAKFLFTDVDVIYSKIRPELRKAAFPRRVGLASADAYPLRVKEGCMPEFLLLVLLSDEFTKESVGRSGRTKMPKVNRRELFTIPFRLPPMSIQRRIVDLVGLLDAQIEALVEEVGHLEAVLASLREALVGKASWTPVRTLVAPEGVQIGPFGAQLHAHDYTEDGVPVVMPQDIHDGDIHVAKIKRVPEVVAASLPRHRLIPGDLVLPRRGDLTKRALVGPDQRGWLCGTGSIRLRLADPTLAPALLEGLSTGRTDEWLTTNAVGTTMLNLNSEIVGKMPAPIFSAEDRKYAEAPLAARRLIKSSRQEIASLRLLSSKVLSALLKGDVQIPRSYDLLMEVL